MVTNTLLSSPFFVQNNTCFGKINLLFQYSDISAFWNIGREQYQDITIFRHSYIPDSQIFLNFWILNIPIFQYFDILDFSYITIIQYQDNIIFRYSISEIFRWPRNCNIHIFRYSYLNNSTITVCDISEFRSIWTLEYLDISRYSNISIFQ